MAGMFQNPRPTIGDQQLVPTGMSGDVSLETPDGQYAALSAMLEANDLANPAPNTSTPPFGEPTPYDEYTPIGEQEAQYLIAPDLEPQADLDLDASLTHAFGPVFPSNTWENDAQYHGLGVPPGVPNWNQPIESGHTQIIVPNPSAELGWDAWSGRNVIARVARHENGFDAYGAGTSRGHNIPIREVQNRSSSPYTSVRMGQFRNMLLAEINRRGIHNLVVADVPAQTVNEQVAVVDPTLLAPEPHIGPEGVLP